jgi:hypothetical protein
MAAANDTITEGLGKYSIGEKLRALLWARAPDAMPGGHCDGAITAAGTRLHPGTRQGGI